MDALTGLRVRLSHLPCLLVAEGPDASADVCEAAAKNLLDACTSVVDLVGLDAQATAALHRAGAWHVQLPGAAVAQGSTVRSACMTGNSGESALLQVPPGSSHSAGTLSAWLTAASAGGTKALGLRGGSLAPGDWADLFVVPLGDLPSKRQGLWGRAQQEPEGDALARHLTLLAPQLQPSWMLVAGREVL